jgi:hypothetical protein
MPWPPLEISVQQQRAEYATKTQDKDLARSQRAKIPLSRGNGRLSSTVAVMTIAAINTHNIAVLPSVAGRVPE